MSLHYDVGLNDGENEVAPNVASLCLPYLNNPHSRYYYFCWFEKSIFKFGYNLEFKRRVLQKVFWTSSEPTIRIYSRVQDQRTPKIKQTYWLRAKCGRKEFTLGSKANI